jgi:hypothetical protein
LTLQTGILLPLTMPRFLDPKMDPSSFDTSSTYLPDLVLSSPGGTRTMAERSAPSANSTRRLARSEVDYKLEAQVDQEAESLVFRLTPSDATLANADSTDTAPQSPVMTIKKSNLVLYRFLPQGDHQDRYHAARGHPYDCGRNLISRQIHGNRVRAHDRSYQDRCDAYVARAPTS